MNLRTDVAEAAKIRLDIGCGANLQPGWTGIDARAFPEYDSKHFVQHDLENVPWPLPDGCASIIQASHIMEHILPRKFIPVMDEMWRVLEPGGQAWITGPYGWSHGFIQDPTHTKPLNETLFAYFTPKDWTGRDSVLFTIYEPKPWEWIKQPEFALGVNILVLLKTIKKETWKEVRGLGAKQDSGKTVIPK